MYIHLFFVVHTRLNIGGFGAQVVVHDVGHHFRMLGNVSTSSEMGAPSTVGCNTLHSEMRENRVAVEEAQGAAGSRDAMSPG